MLQTWNLYFALCVAAVLAAGIPLAVYLISRFVAHSGKSSSSEPSSSLNGALLGKRIQLRFFSGLCSGAALILLGFLLFLCIGSLGNPRVILLVLFLTTVIGVGLFYAVKKKDLDWELE